MTAGTIKLTNGSKDVIGTGTAFTTDSQAADFIITTVGGTVYSLAVDKVTDDTHLSLVLEFDGPTTTGAAWQNVPYGAQMRLTQQMGNDLSRVLRFYATDKTNWNKLLSGPGEVTIDFPDGTQQTGPSWPALIAASEAGIQYRGEIQAGVNLNTLGPDNDGVWFQSVEVNAAASLNYPEANKGGTLEVLPHRQGVMQRYTAQSGKVYLRVPTAQWNGTDGPWSPWRNANNFITPADYGITGAGGEDEKWKALIADCKNVKAVHVPSGTYQIDSEIAAEGLTLIADRVSFSGNGYLKQAVIFGISSSGTPYVDMGSTVGKQDIRWGKMFKIGGPDQGMSGLQIGGAGGGKFGTEGMGFYMDAYDGWIVEQPTRWPSSAEHALMPNGRSGLCSFTAGNKTITIKGGADLLAEDVGQAVWIKDLVYTIESVGSRSFTVTTAPSATGSETFTVTYNNGKGKCNVNGKLLKCISGDPLNFVVPTRIVVNGVQNFIDGFTDTRNVILRNDMGTLTNVDFRWTGSIDDLAAAFRLHRVAGAGYEENLSIIAYNKGYYHFHAGAGGPSQFPIYHGSGWDSNGVARKSVTISGDGYVSIGGQYGRASMEFAYTEYAAGDRNRLRAEPGAPGSPAVLTVAGPDANIALTLRSKGTAATQVSGNFGVTGTTYLGSETTVNGFVIPSTDASNFCIGSASRRWAAIYAVTGTINTSDANMKDRIEEITEVEARVARKIKGLMRKYVLKDSLEEKGDDARIHFGVIAQDVESAFAAEGLDASRYSLFCRDEVAPGEFRLGIRYTELLCFIIAAI